MRIAVPVANKELCNHFGHCEVFSFFDVDEKSKKIITRNDITPPPHEPGILPKWIGGQGANLVLAGGMGQRAQELFKENGVKVVVGVSESNPEKAVLDFLNNKLTTGANVCDH
ncbi:MAG: ATPase [Bdellovibrionales bacterium RIFOXYA1_FULL_36_14]|nr:MAG: ATPase [Bdellovibrionales bacterium RIFOXYA1_FULL_36_14]